MEVFHQTLRPFNIVVNQWKVLQIVNQQKLKAAKELLETSGEKILSNFSFIVLQYAS